MANLQNVILIPTFNDWRSLNKLIKTINKSFKSKKFSSRIVIINDCSTTKIKLDNKKLSNIKSIEVLNLKKNLGSQKAIYIGLKYLKKIKFKSIITIMDSDGEDDPYKVFQLISLAKKNKKFIITANRSKRTENVFYKFINFIRLSLTYLLTGKYLNFGNFGSFYSFNLKKILSDPSISLAYSAGIAKTFKKLKIYPIEKKRRFFGNSKVNFIFLIQHSFNIISVFNHIVFLRTLLILLISFYFFNILIFFFITIIFLFLNIFILLNRRYHFSANYGLQNIESITKFKC